VNIYYAITDSTSASIRLNSSKLHHDPDEAKPLKNLPYIGMKGLKDLRIAR
jgi:hypothetical protein